MTQTPEIFIPAIRAHMGDWWFYVATLTFRQVADRIKRVSEIHEKKELKTWIQREIKDERIEEISDYIQSQPQRFFNGIVLGLYGGDPDWFPIDVSRNLAKPEIELSERIETAFGLIRLTGTEEIFAIDGQHRVEGIKQALKSNGKKLDGEDQTVIFVAHKTTDAGRERTRRLFTTLNKYAKPVSKGEIIALSEDDTFAIVTRQLVNDYPGLGGEFVPLMANLPTSDKKSLTSLIALYEVVSTISLPPRKRERKRLETGPPSAEEVQKFYQISVEFWDALKKYVPAIKEISASDPDAEVAAKYRNKNGGNLLLRPFGLTCAAKAVRVLMDRGFTTESAVQEISKVQLELSENPWRNVLWNPTKRAFTAKSTALAKNLLLVCAGHKPDPEGFDVEDAYLRAIGEAQTEYRPPKPKR